MVSINNICSDCSRLCSRVVALPLVGTDDEWLYYLSSDDDQYIYPTNSGFDKALLRALEEEEHANI